MVSASIKIVRTAASVIEVSVFKASKLEEIQCNKLSLQIVVILTIFSKKCGHSLLNSLAFLTNSRTAA